MLTALLFQNDLVIYEMNVRAFTADESSGMDPSILGSYVGVIEKVVFASYQKCKCSFTTSFLDIFFLVVEDLSTCFIVFVVIETVCTIPSVPSL